MKECPACRRCFPDHVNHCPDDGDETTHSIAGEPILDGRYQLERRLGHGGMGVVFQARHIFLKTAHAIKVILPDLVGNDPMLVTRFRQEALAAAAIRHQNIIAVTDFGVARGTMPFLVMEYVSGKSLHELLAKEGALPPARAVELMSAIGAGVGAAHRQGIVHRDLKPLNIMMQEGQPIAEGLKVLDFGLAKIKSGELLGSFVQAKTSGLMGSPFYMAPEQWGDEEPDARADIYSLGVILFQMLTGDVPFRGTGIPSIMKKHLTAEPPSFASLNVSVPPEIERVVRHALEKEAEDRPASVEEFVRELRTAVETLTAALKSTSLGSAALPPSNSGALSTGGLSSHSMGQMTMLRVQTNPPQSRVFINNVSVGASDASGELVVPDMMPGIHSIRILREGYADWEQQVECRGGECRVEAQLHSQMSSPNLPPLEDPLAGTISSGTLNQVVLSPADGIKSASGEKLASADETSKPLYADENVQFTVYRPEKIKPQRTYKLLAFAHLSERRAGAPPDELDPLAQVKKDAAEVLGAQHSEYIDVQAKSAQPVPYDGELTFTPYAPGLDFNPPSFSFKWREAVHQQVFEMSARPETDGHVVQGGLRVYLGGVIIGEVKFDIIVDSAATEAETIVEAHPPTASRFTQIFASYSHRDAAVVQELALIAPLFGHKYLMDRTDLVPGEDWRHGLRRLIAQADVFQLFWSQNSMYSEEVRNEVLTALELNKRILPTYWEDPLPRNAEQHLPPAEIERLHFQRIRPGALSHLAGASVAQPSWHDEQERIAREELAREEEARLQAQAAARRKEEEERQRLLAAEEQRKKVEGETLARQRAEEERAQQFALEVERRAAEESARLEQERREREEAERVAAAGRATREQQEQSISPELPEPSKYATRPLSAADLESLQIQPPRVTAAMESGSLPEIGQQSVWPAQQMPAPIAPPPAQASMSGVSVSAPKPKKSMLPLIMTLTVAVIFVGGSIGAFLLWSRNGSQNVNTNQTGGPTPTPQATPGPIKPDLVEIPGGTFQMGRNGAPNPVEGPPHTATVKAFAMDRTEVTNAEYEVFVRETKHRAPSHWADNKPLAGQEQWPVTNVSYDDAVAFAGWRSKRDGVTYRLPTEEEWEFAARDGAQANLYPWGNDWEQTRAVIDEASPRPVNSLPEGKNRWGVVDLIGNVWEWTASKASLYPGNNRPIPPDTRDWMIYRGGSYGTKMATGTTRDWQKPSTTHPTLGFRLIRTTS